MSGKVTVTAGNIQISEALGKAFQEVADAQDVTKKSQHLSTQVERSGTKIILPAEPKPMTSKQAIEALQRQMELEDADVQIMEVIDALPYDGAVAFTEAMRRRYGWVDPIPTPGFFGPTPPTMISVNIDYGKTRQVLWGSFQIPGITGKLQTRWGESNGTPVLQIVGITKRKFEAEVHELADLARKIAAEESIYRGKAFRMRANPNGLDFEAQPEFMATDLNPSALVFSRDLEKLVDINIFTPIRKTGHCRMYGIPLKRGVLLEGTYGTGKTLIAAATASLAVENNWTFILLSDVAGLGEAIEFAKRYSPVVIFAEDIDRTMAGDRDAHMDNILNTIDGMGNKMSEIMVILTTNDVSAIEPAMLRPGRLDVVLSITRPDAEAVQRLIRLYGKDVIEAHAQFPKAGEELAGQIPATIREVVERAKLAALSSGSHTTAGIRLSDDDLVITARGMKQHLELLNPREPDLTPAMRLGQALVDVMFAEDGAVVATLAKAHQNTIAIAQQIEVDATDIQY